MLDHLSERDVDALWRSVHREIRRRGVDAQTADDLAQEAWLRTLRRAPDRGELGGWLRVVGRRLVSEMRRQRGNRREREKRAARQPTSVDLHLPGESPLWKWVEELGEPYRSVLLARFLEGLEVGEIARRSGHTPATVRSQLHRGLNQLRARLGIDESRRRTPRGFLWWRGTAARPGLDLAPVLGWAAGLGAAAVLAWGAWRLLATDPRGAFREPATATVFAADRRDGAGVGPSARIPASAAARVPEPGVPDGADSRRTVAGQVLRPDGLAGGGAEIWAGELENGAERLVARADDTGRYEVPDIGRDEYLWARAGDGLLSRRCYVGSMAEAARHDLRLLSSPGRLRLTLSDADGQPVAGARVWLDGEVGGALVSVVTRSGAVEIPTRSMRAAVTDAGGNAWLPKPDRRRLALFVALDGQLVASPELVGTPGDQDLSVVLPRPGSLGGVVRGPGGAVQAGVEVELRLVNDVLRTTRSDPMGRFLFEGLPPRRYCTWALTGANQAPLSAGKEVPVEAGEAAEVELCLNQDLVVHGRVLEDGRPVPQARVKLFLQGKDGVAALFDQPVDEDGGFRYAGVGPEVLRAEAFVPGRSLPVAWSGDVPPGSGPVLLEVTPRSRLLVPVTVEFPGGDPARPPVLAAIRGRSPRVLLQGSVDPVTRRATFELPPGQYGVYAWIPGLGPWLSRERLQVAATARPESPRVRRFPVPRPGRLRLRLDLPPEVPPEQIDTRIRAGLFSPFGFRELGSVECLHEGLSDPSKRLLEVDLLPGRAACAVDVAGFLDEQVVVQVPDGGLIEVELAPERGRELELVADCPIHFGIHETLDLEMRSAAGRSRRRTVQPIAVRREVEGGRRLELRLSIVVPLDTLTLRLSTRGATGELRWPAGHLAALPDGASLALPMRED